jgi:formylglycine-generating enzyme required for sulfatase activity
MVDVGVACIDRYEAPNEPNAKPLRMQSADDAESFCRARDKRLCTEDEWLRACRGPSGTPYPYGSRYDEHACNHDKQHRVPSWKLLASWPSEQARAEADRLDQSEPSGARSSCVSAEGVHDLTGNVAEWVKKTRAHPEACLDAEMAKHTHVLQGCSWVKCYRKPHEPACGYVNCAHPSGFRSYEAGFRCCKDRKP